MFLGTIQVIKHEMHDLSLRIESTERQFVHATEQGRKDDAELFAARIHEYKRDMRGHEAACKVLSSIGLVIADA